MGALILQLSRSSEKSPECREPSQDRAVLLAFAGAEGNTDPGGSVEGASSSTCLAEEGTAENCCSADTGALFSGLGNYLASG